MKLLRRKSSPDCVGCVELPKHGRNWERRVASLFKAILGTASLRSLWAPACKAKGDVYLAAYRALDACLKAHGYAPRAKDTGAYNCRRITGGTGYSLHSYGPADRFTFWNGVRIATALAFDLNWTTNPYGKRLVTDMPPAMRTAIKAIRTNSGKQVWGWGGDYRTNLDAMHWEIVCSPKDLATGIDPRTVPGYKPPVPANPGKWQQFAKGATDAAIHAKGGKDNQVSELQMLLKMLGFFRSNVDGSYGPITTSAVIAAKDAYRWPDRSSLIDAPFMLKLRTLAMER